MLDMLAVLLGLPTPDLEPRIAFPRDPSVIDAKLDLGARGDGVTDDTDALQRGLDMSSGVGGAHRVLFIPAGTYRVTRMLTTPSGIGPFVYGAGRNRTTLRMADGSGAVAVLMTHPTGKDPTSADWFMRTVRHLTLDAGNNPGTDGIRWFSNNSGSLQWVRVRGNGPVGVNSAFLGQNGPNLIQDVSVEGFGIGVKSQWIWGQTLSRVHVRGSREVGVSVVGNAVGIEDLTVERAPVGLEVGMPEDWFWWSGLAAVVGARFDGGRGAQAAIRNKGVFYGRDIRARGFPINLDSEWVGPDVHAPTLREYSSHLHRSAWPSPETALGLPIEPEPPIVWEADPAKWVIANDHGAAPGDNQDDTSAIQEAFDSAARQGKTVVAFRGVAGGDPNWYTIRGPIRVHGSVRLVLGLGWARILPDPEGRFVVDAASASHVHFRNIDSFGGPPPIVENSGPGMVSLDNCGVHVLASGPGRTWLTSCPALLTITNERARVWARQLNPEGTSDTGLVQNHGGSLWALGIKSEGAGVKFLTTRGGKTDLYGMFMYGPGIDENDQRPMLDTDNASFSIAGLREISFGNTYPVKVREKRGDEVRTHSLLPGEHGWIGWSLYSGFKPPPGR